MKEENQSVKKNFIYNSLYQILIIIIPLITTPYIARVLGTEKIGIYSYSYAVAYYFVMFIMLGLNNYGNRTIAGVRDDKNKISRCFIEIYSMQLIISNIVVLLYLLYILLFSNNLISWIMLIYVVSAAIDINWLFFGLEQFKLTVVRNTIIKILATISIFAFVKTENDLYIYAVINVISLLINHVILFFFIKKYIALVKIKPRDIAKHIKPNLMLFIPVVAISIYKMMDKIMLGNLSSFNQVGFYENTEKIVQVPVALITSLGTIMLPKISNLISKKDYEKAIYYFEKSIYFAIMLSSVLCFGIMGVASEFVPWYFGKNYSTCIALFQILMPSCIFLAVANVVRTQYLIPYKNDKIYIKSVVLGAIINLVINGLLIPRYGAIGASIGTLIAESTVCIIQVFSVRKKIYILKYISNAIPFVINGFIMYFLLMIFPNIFGGHFLNLIIKVLFGGGVYLILSLVFIVKRFDIRINK